MLLLTAMLPRIFLTRSSHDTRTHRVLSIALAATILLFTPGCSVLDLPTTMTVEDHASNIGSEPTRETHTVWEEKLQALAVEDYDPQLPDYHRDAFGQRWSDDVDVGGGHNGCDTRNDILARDLTNVQYKPKTHDCVVISGVLDDPYTGTTIEFQRGERTSEEVPIDHVVALANAWYSGAYRWDETTRRNFANDPLNLQATTRVANQTKKAKSAEDWMPQNPNYRCEYARRQVEIKTTYALSVTPSEQAALADALARCTD